MSRYRDYKPSFEGAIFHAFNRGNNRQPIFHEEADYYAFLRRCRIILGQATEIDKRGLELRPLDSGAFTILEYCLMPNHFHFLLRQNGGLPIHKFFSRLCASYASYVNRKYERVGGLFQDQFKAKLVDTDEYLKQVSAYIHMNPDQPYEYPFSSLGQYLRSEVGIADTAFVLDAFERSTATYRNFLDGFKKSDTVYEDFGE